MKIIHQLIGLLIVCYLFIACESEGDETMPISSCNDQIQNGLEEGIDCGGDCTPCSPTVEVPDGGFESPESRTGYSLIWSDEFSNSGVDTEKWSYHLGDGCPNLCNWGNNELQYYTQNEENIFTQDGYLVIRAINERLNGYNYTSARIHSDDKFEFKYGRVDIRAAMPEATGTWVALWLINKSYSIYNPDKFWPSGGEIDIAEYVGEAKDEILGTAHFGTDFPVNHRYISKKYITKQHPFHLAFYVFSIEWEKDKITWLVNDQVYHEVNTSSTNAFNQPYPFN
ncbi:MAG: glycoside hydrolase family 16 protein, partial [Bacteroidota bacterium]